MPVIIAKAHVIAKYKHKANEIICKCGWAGNRQEWDTHKSEMRSLKKQAEV